MVEKIKAQVAAEHDEVRELGGLYVVGTERHESRRIDNQLRGRSGRQGDPGESRFYLSLEDELMRLFKSDWVDRILQVMRIPDDVPIENKRVTGAIANAQGQVESQNFESRKNVLKYDDVMSRQREVIYGERREVLEGADLESQVREFIDDVVEGYVATTTEDLAEEWDLDALWSALGQLYVGRPRPGEVRRRARRPAGPVPRAARLADLQADAQAAYDRRVAEVGDEVMRELERRVVLSVLDRKWREHLYEMDYLREGIYLRAYSQRDPLVEYQREGFDMFAAMMNGIKEESVGFLFNLEVTVDEEDDDDEGEEVVEPMRQEIPDFAAAESTNGAPAGRRSRVAGHPPGAGTSGPAASRSRSRRRSSPTPGPRRGSVRGRRRPPGSGRGTTASNADDPLRHRRPERGVPLRLGQEVQEVPRRSRRSDRPHRPRQRLSRPR